MDTEHLNQLFLECLPLFNALGDEKRLTIIKHLTDAGETGLNVNDITEKTSLSRPAISHHLKILKDAGIIDVRQSGTSNFYFLTIIAGADDFFRLSEHLRKVMSKYE